MSENILGIVGILATLAWTAYIVFASRYTYPTNCKTKREQLINKHGTLAEFTTAVRLAEEQLFCTTAEADLAIKKYKNELDECEQ